MWIGVVLSLSSFNSSRLPSLTPSPDELAMRLTVGARHLFSQLSPAALENQTSIARQRIGEDWSTLSEDVAACVAANRDAAQFIINLGEVCTADLLAILLT